jgi:methyl-accepting chemotaxis protein
MPMRLSLQAKFFLIFSVIGLFMILISGIGYYALYKTSITYAHVVEINLPNAVELAKIRGAQKDLVAITALLVGKSVNLEKYEDSKKEIIAVHERFQKASKTYEDVPFVEGEDALWKGVVGAWNPFYEMSEKMLELSKNGKAEDYAARDHLFDNEYTQLRKNFLEKINGLIAFQEKQAETWSAGAKKNAELWNQVSIATSIASVFFSLCLGFFFIRGLTKSLNAIAEQISNSAEQTSAASTQLTQTSTSLSEGVTEGAASLEETVASLEELMSMVKRNSENTKEASSLSGTSKEAAEKGDFETQQLIVTMQEMVADSKQIADIVTLIDDIAFQTNLLALNAAVEAARAGEQGKGFAVVADAVRTLAQKSAEAAKNIKTLIEVSVQRVDSGSRVAASSGKMLKTIVDSIYRVSTFNSEIAASSSEQATGLEQIGKAMNQLDQATQTNAASSEEVAASAEELSAQAQSLQNLAGDLQGLISGAKVVSSRNAPPTLAPAPRSGYSAALKKAS